MLTFLIVDKVSGAGIFSLKRKIRTEIKSSGGIDVRYIKCSLKGRKINWDKIRKLCSDDADRLLCSKELNIPEGKGIRRFCCNELKIRLSLNMAIEALSRCKGSAESIRVAVYDPDAVVADGVGAMLKYTDSLTVVTRMTGIYRAEAERIMDESGAVLNVSKSIRSLSTAQLVVAPLKLSTVLPLDKTSVVLTCEEPACAQRCIVLSSYYFQLDNELALLLPKGFESEYFASALYTLCSRFELGSLVPLAAKGVGCEHTLVSLPKYLMNIALNT